MSLIGIRLKCIIVSAHLIKANTEKGYYPGGQCICVAFNMSECLAHHLSFHKITNTRANQNRMQKIMQFMKEEKR